MPVYNKKVDFFTSEEGLMSLEALKEMDANNNYSTESSYSANTELYSNNRISFIDKHMIYMRNHPSIDPRQYIANLRLMTKVR